MFQKTHCLRRGTALSCRSSLALSYSGFSVVGAGLYTRQAIPISGSVAQSLLTVLLGYSSRLCVLCVSALVFLPQSPTSRSAPNRSSPPQFPAATFVAPANYPVSPPAARKKPCTSARILYACNTPGAASRPYIDLAESPDTRVAASTNAPNHLRKCTNTASPRGISNHARALVPHCAETR
jgi:hypothetical protein